MTGLEVLNLEKGFRNYISKVRLIEDATVLLPHPHS